MNQLSAVFQACVSEKEIVKAAEDLTEDKIFKIVSENILVKTFVGQDAKKRCQKEMQGLKHLRTLKLPSFVTPEVISSQDLNTRSLLKIAAPRGKSLDDLIRSNGDPEKTLKAVYTIGEIIGTIHRMTLKEIVDLKDTDWDGCVKDIEVTIHLVQKHHELYPSLNIPSFVELIEYFRKAMEKRPGYCCMTYGDASPANWYVDNDSVTALGSASMNKRGFYAKEFYCFLSAFRNIGNCYKLSEKRIVNLQDAFQKGYRTCKSLSVNERSANFFRVYWMCRAFNDCSKFLLVPNKYDSAKKELAESMLKRLSARINNEIVGKVEEYF